MLKKLCMWLGGVFLAIAVSGTLQAAFAAVTVTVTPTNPGIAKGADKLFAVQVSGAMNPAVTWSVNNIPNGNPTVGVISTSGKYIAPSNAAAGSQVTVRATSVEDPNAVGVATVTIMNPAAVLSSVSPNSFPVGAFNIQVNGANFVSGAVVKFNGAPLSTVYVSSNVLKASGNASATGTFAVTVVNPIAASSAGLPVYVGGGGSTPPPLPPPPAISVNVSPANTAILLGGAQQFSATVLNTTNTTVIWKVNGTPNGDPGGGLISSTGLYMSPAQMPPTNVVTISAMSAADNTKVGSTTLTIKNPQAITLGRFADQVTFGPTPADLARIQQLGFDAYIDEQLSLAESPWPVDSASKTAAMDAFWGNARAGNDQLRQRVIYAFSEIIVISLNKNVNGEDVIPWLKILSRNAFGNYRQLLKEITLDGGMGHYLDLANSGGGGAPNENYPREVMQLFSVGLVQLNDDGSPKLDQNNKPIPTYTQTDVVELAKALTGWTWNSPTGLIGGGGNNSYFPGPMLPMPSRHVGGPKTILGKTLPAGQSIQQDLDGAIDAIFSHPNVAPFIATRLIRALVTSNPSPAYIKAVADVFNDNGYGQKGDMKAVIKAVLLNPEARQDNPGPNFGRLRTPEQFLIAVARELNLGLNTISNSNYLLENMNEGVLDAPSVFGHYSPLFRIPNGGGLFGPEFQIYSASDAVNRANFLYSMLYFYPSNPAIAPYVSLATNPQGLADAVDNAMLFGRMSPTLRNAIVGSLAAMPDNNQRAIEALYLTAMSGEFLVQR